MGHNQSVQVKKTQNLKMESSSHSKMVSQTLPKCHWDGCFTWISWNLGRFILARKRRVRLEALFQKSQHLNSWISWIFKTYTYHQSYLCPSSILLVIPRKWKLPKLYHSSHLWGNCPTQIWNFSLICPAKAPLWQRSPNLSPTDPHVDVDHGLTGETARCSLMFAASGLQRYVYNRVHMCIDIYMCMYIYKYI